MDFQNKLHFKLNFAKISLSFETLTDFERNLLFFSTGCYENLISKQSVHIDKQPRIYQCHKLSTTRHVSPATIGTIALP